MRPGLAALPILLLLISGFETAHAGANADVVVYGGTSAGVAAAVEAARGGKSVLLIEPSGHLGGMSSSGLGWTDVGQPDAIGGFARELYHRVWLSYQSNTRWRYQTRDSYLSTVGQGVSAIDEVRQLMWVFEPHVAEQAFSGLASEAGVRVVRGRLDLKRGVIKSGSRIDSIRLEGGRVLSARIFIDASYEGDLMAKAGVSYTVGREGNAAYGESANGIETRLARVNQLPPGLDPYVVRGVPGSGLLPNVNPNPGGPDGAGDRRVQACCFRLCLTDMPGNRIPVEKPAGYQSSRYELLFRVIEAGQSEFFKLDPVPNLKTDSNNGSGMSFNLVGGSDAYPEADYAGRDAIVKAHESWQRGFLWTLQHHPRVPASIRASYAAWGLARDEFADTRHWPRRLYVREARRMVGTFIETEHTVLNDSPVRQSIGLGAYTIDFHNVQRYVDSSGQVQNEGDGQIAVPRPYRIDYGAIIPSESECSNLIVPVCLSASHVAYGSLRTEPVFMIMGHSAGAAASVAIDAQTSVQQVPYAALRARLLADGQLLEWPPAGSSLRRAGRR